ncbi:hypothetical protein Tco_0984876 [Tanacetum coccineum]
MESSSSQANQPYSPVNHINLDMDFQQLMFSQEYYPSQDYSMGHGSAHGSTHGSAPVNDDEEDDSPVEEVLPVKPKKPSRPDEAEEETQEVRPPGRDQSKAKKKSTASSRGKSSSFVDLVADKFLNIKKEKRNKREEKQQQSYIQLKNRELDIREAERREAAELKREKMAIQLRTLELAEREKRDKDILLYNTEINSSLPVIQQKLQEMKDEIRERHDLDY